MSEEEVAEKAKPKQEKLLPWLRPCTGLFSVFTGLMYLLAALGFAMLAISASHQAKLSEEKLDEYIEQIVKEEGKTTEQAAEFLQVRIDIGEQLGGMFPLQMAFICCLCLLIIASGVGLFLKKSRAVSLGRMSCIFLILTIVAVIVLNKESAAFIWERLNVIEPDENYKPFGWMSAARYMFLFSMCPVALLIAYGAIVKHYAAKNLD